MTKKLIEVIRLNKDGKETTEKVELDVPDLEVDDDFWCRCSIRHDTVFHEDEYDDEGMRVSKHFYSCSKCGRVVQIG